MKLLYYLFGIGYDKNGFNRNGYDKDGYNRNGFDKVGYDRDGLNEDGYDRNGYDKNGYDQNGIDKDGYSRFGLDVDGYDRNGYDKYGYNRECFGIDGYNQNGLDKDGYNRLGLDNDGYDRNGYDKNGFNREGYGSDGYNKNGLDKDGYNRLGLDNDGYDRNGYDKNGYDRNGFDKDGYDQDGYNQKKDLFVEAQNKYINKSENCEALLAYCYLNGIGLRIDMHKAFTLIVEGAYNKSFEALKLLGYCYSSGIVVSKNTNLAQFLYDLADDKNPPPMNKYKSLISSTYKPKRKEVSTFKLEENHLNDVLNSINNKISSIENRIKRLDRDTSWMDRDQLDNWATQNDLNRDRRYKIIKLESIKKRPYYARMDTMSSDVVETFYIGEEAYSDYNNPENKIVSVWSEYGRRYRQKNEHVFSINEYQYKVVLRRSLDIANGELIDTFDEYIDGSFTAQAQITDPFLLKILNEKKSETNITNIIRSIQLNQNDIIDYDFDKSLIVQGCAGSGKTMILLHRLANMKYNIPKLDLSKIKIITPNSQFNLFIDELSKNLGIEQIEKKILGEYYISLLGKYRLENQKQYNKKIVVKARNGNHIEQTEAVWIETGSTVSDELKTLCDDAELSFDFVTIIYSDKFATILANAATTYRYKHDKNEDYGSAAVSFKNAFKLTLYEMGINEKINKNYTCVLYAKLLYMYSYYGTIANTDTLLCIDEGQDISKSQYSLIKKVNGNNLKFNIYGDLVQQIPQCYGIKSWDNFLEVLDAKLFVLNENYRNSDNIINFYNKMLGIGNKSFGLETKPVEKITLEDLLILLKLQLVLKNRTAIITNHSSNLTNEIKELCTSEVITQRKAILLTVKQSKGLEFDTVFVFDSDMVLNERYIAYSRALSELYIVE